MKKLNENKLNNKGFSLVELIIVIAIMAVLIGVLAPQYLKYVEKSRKSSDIDNVDQMISAAEIYSADPANAVVDGTIVCAAGSLTTTGNVNTALGDAGINNLPAMKSSAYKNWTITFAATGVSFSQSDDGKALQAALGR